MKLDNTCRVRLRWGILFWMWGVGMESMRSI